MKDKAKAIKVKMSLSQIRAKKTTRKTRARKVTQIKSQVMVMISLKTKTINLFRLPKRSEILARKMSLTYLSRPQEISF
jgi:hypothetical protein